MVKEFTYQCRRYRRLQFDSLVGRSLEKEIDTPVFLPGESHGQREAWRTAVHGGRKESDMTEQLSLHDSVTLWKTKDSAFVGGNRKKRGMGCGLCSDWVRWINNGCLEIWSAGSGYNKDWNTEIKNLGFSPNLPKLELQFYLRNGFLHFLLEYQIRIRKRNIYRSGKNSLHPFRWLACSWMLSEYWAAFFFQHPRLWRKIESSVSTAISRAFRDWIAVLEPTSE